MPGAAAPGGPSRIAASREFQALALAVRVLSDEEAVLEAVEFLAQDALQDVAIAEAVSYTVHRHEESYVIGEDGITVATEFYAHGVIGVLLERLYRRAVLSMQPTILLRGLVGRAAKRRFLVVGAPGCGLTTLALRLLSEGLGVEGDALALIAEGQVVALPRPFYLHREAHALALPDVSNGGADLPHLEGPGGMDVVAVHPDRSGAAWHINRGPVEAIIELQADHGLHTRLSPQAHYRMARTLTGCLCDRVGRSVGECIADLAQLADGAECWRLQLGRPADALAALRPALG